MGRVGVTEVRTPFAGQVVGWLAAAGERVQEGQPLVWMRVPGDRTVSAGDRARWPGRPGHRRVIGASGPPVSAWFLRQRGPGGHHLPIRRPRARARGRRCDRFLAVRCDVTDPAQVEAAFATVESAWGPVEVLVANAGITRDTLIAAHERGRVHRGHRHQPDRRRSGWPSGPSTKMLRLHRGRIIFVSSVGAFVGLPGQANYAASKAGLVGMARALAREVASRADHGQRGGARPGRHRYDRGPRDETGRADDSPGPAGPDRAAPDEIADAVGFLASDRRRLHHRRRPAGRRRPGHGPLTGQPMQRARTPNARSKGADSGQRRSVREVPGVRRGGAPGAGGEGHQGGPLRRRPRRRQPRPRRAGHGARGDPSTSRSRRPSSRTSRPSGRPST